MVRRMCLAIGLLVVILGCAGAPATKQKPRSKQMTADELLTTVLKETDGKCNLADLRHECVIAMVPTGRDGEVLVQVAARERYPGDSIVESVHFTWSLTKNTVTRTK